jgi:hypothetical protein
MQTAGAKESSRHDARKSKPRAVLAFTLLALLAALILPLTGWGDKLTTAHADDLLANPAPNEMDTFAVDVALGVHYYQNSKDPTETAHDPAAFSEGDTLFQDGAVYREGTIPPGSNTFDLSTPGAIGTYKVRGTWIIDLANFERAVAHDASAAAEMAFATEILTFGNDGSAIMTDGMYPNAYFSARRVVLGGTGRFRGAAGEVEAENIGETAYGCNFRLKFKIRRATGGIAR